MTSMTMFTSSQNSSNLYGFIYQSRCQTDFDLVGRILTEDF